MAEVRWTPQAADDPEAIAGCIAADSPHYASLFAADVLRAVERPGPFPRSGRTVPELDDPAIREIPPGSYRIVYRVKDELVEILTVCRCARLLDPDSLR